jgi:hypothetical protein
VTSSSTVEVRRHRTGIGDNPRFRDGRLTVPACASYLEAGAGLLLQPSPPRVLPAGGDLSLHLARAPFCEEPAVQDHFAAAVAARLPAVVTSIGMHLCGPLDEPLARFGFGTGFTPLAEHRERAVRFADAVREATGRPILIENANYYDGDLSAALRILDSVNELCERAGCRVILDLAHLLMNANNLGCDPHFLLGRIDLGRVDVVHLSGVSRSADGTMHDGHQLPVAEPLWELLTLVLAAIGHPVTIVIEHTDPRWTDDDPAFAGDHARLHAMLDRGSTPWQPAHAVDEWRVAAGYLTNVVLAERFPEVVAGLGREVFAELVRTWAARFAARTPASATVVLRHDERSLYREPLVDPIADFVSFLREVALR